MMTHADLLAAIDKARADQFSAPGLWTARQAHCDDLAALAALHTEGGNCCNVCTDDNDMSELWPCQTVQLIIDRLNQWGAL